MVHCPPYRYIITTASPAHSVTTDISPFDLTSERAWRRDGVFPDFARGFQILQTIFFQFPESGKDVENGTCQSRNRRVKCNRGGFRIQDSAFPIQARQRGLGRIVGLKKGDGQDDNPTLRNRVLWQVAFVLGAAARRGRRRARGTGFQGERRRGGPGSPGHHDLSDMFDIFEKLVESPEDS